MSVQPAVFSPTNEDIAGLGTGPIPADPYYRPEYFELERVEGTHAQYRRHLMITRATADA
jgi:hypothetical protein